jgi:hypothetical protein
VCHARTGCKRPRGARRDLGGTQPLAAGATTCGVERRPVKTLSDPREKLVNYKQIEKPRKCEAFVRHRYRDSNPGFRTEKHTDDRTAGPHLRPDFRTG